MSGFLKPEQWLFNPRATADIWTAFWGAALWVVPAWEEYPANQLTDLVSGSQSIIYPSGIVWNGLNVEWAENVRGLAADYLNPNSLWWPNVTSPFLSGNMTQGWAGIIPDLSAFGSSLVLGLTSAASLSSFTPAPVIDTSFGPMAVAIEYSGGSFDTGYRIVPNVPTALSWEITFGVPSIALYVNGVLWGTFLTPTLAADANLAPTLGTCALSTAPHNVHVQHMFAFICAGLLGADFHKAWASDPFGPIRNAPIIKEVTPFNWFDTIESQYANSPTLLQLLDYFNQNVDPLINIDDFYFLVWNVLTAQGWGLDVWGRIVGIGRVLNVTSQYLGFEEAADLSLQPFNNAPLYSGDIITNGFRLSDPAYRTLILAKAAANITGCSIPDINAVLRLLFPGHVAYVTDGQNMTMTYTLHFNPTPFELALAEVSGVLPKPTGVSATVVEI